MSGRSRNLIQEGKLALPFGSQLPKVICESPVTSPGNNFGEEISVDASDRFNLKNKFRYYSTTSSAQSQRFQDMFYKTDWPSLSDTGTDSPDCIELEGSDSSASSMFSWADAEGTRMVAEEWEKIQRTLYNEDGPKVTQKHLIEECNQWRTMFPHLRVIGHSCGVADLDFDDNYDTEEEVLALHYDSDVDSIHVPNAPFLMNERLYQENTNTKLVPLANKKKSNQKNSRQISSHTKVRSKSSTTSLIDELDSLLQITPLIQNISKNHYSYANRSSAIVQSEISSSRWSKRNISSPEFVSLPHQLLNDNPIQSRDNSATSIFSLAETKQFLNHNNNTVLNGVSRNKSGYKWQHEKRAKQNVSEKHLLEPLEPILPNRTLPSRSVSIPNTVQSGSIKGRNVSLPPIQYDDNKDRRKHSDYSSLSGKSSRRNKTTLMPIDFSSSLIPKYKAGIDADNLSLSSERICVSKLPSNRKRTSKKK